MKPILSAFFFLLVLSAGALASEVLDSSYLIGDSRTYCNGVGCGTQGNTSYGSLAVLTVTSGNTNIFTRTYMKWDVSSIPVGSTINSATVSLKRSSGDAASRNMSIYNTSDAWAESTITYNNQPVHDQSISNTTITNTNGWKNLSITSALQDAVTRGVNLNIIIVDLNNASYATQNFYSKNNTDLTVRPYLTIDYTTSSNCSSHSVNGTWCAEYNLTPMCSDYLATGCWDPYTESLPNPFNASRSAYMTTTAIDGVDCGIHYNSCPTGYMCIQGSYDDASGFPSDILFPIYTTSLGRNWTWRGTVTCHSDQSLVDLYFNETGDQVNFTDIYTPDAKCQNPTIWGNNSYACILDGCHYCTQEAVCKKPTNSCTNTCLNDTSIGACFDTGCNPVSCAQGTGSNPAGTGTFVGWKTSFNSSMGSEAAASILAVVVSMMGAFVVFLKSKGHKLETFVIPFFIFLVVFAMPGIEFFPLWIYMVLVAFTGVMMFWKAKG